LSFIKKFNTLIEDILLKENPIFVDKPLSMSLNKISTNKSVVNKSLEEGERLNSFEDKEVYKIVNQNLLYFCFIKNNITDAYVEFSIDGDGEANSGTILQRKSEDTKGFLKKAFLDYFPSIFSSIKLDYIANKHGKEFFRKLLKESGERGFKTVVVNQRTKEEASKTLKMVKEAMFFDYKSLF
jgi:hypothetical protein